MGRNFATELSLMEEMPIVQQINLHLQCNFYPPVPSSMVFACIEAIEAYNDEDYDRQIEMPQGVLYQGKDTAPAHAIVSQHHLDPWIMYEEEYYEEYEYQDYELQDFE